MRILLLTYEFPPFHGGVGRYCATLAKGLIDQGHKVMVVVPRKLETRDAARIGVPIKTWRESRGPFRHFAGAYHLYRVIRAYRPQYVLAAHAFSVIPIALLSFVCRFHYALAIMGSEVEQYKNTGTFKDALRRCLFQRTLEKADKLVCISHYSKELLKFAFVVSDSKLCVVYMGLDEARFLSQDMGATQALRQRLGIEHNVVLLTVARLVPRKGHDQVLRALSQLVPSVPSIHYLIVGSGPDEMRLHQIVAELHLEPYVTFAGCVADQDLNNYYDLADIYVMPSRQEGDTVEGFGLVFLEAGVRGLPVIGGRHGGVREAVIDGETGYLVDPLCTDELAQRIMALIEAPSLRRRFGEQGRRRVVQEFTVVKMTERTVEALLK